MYCSFSFLFQSKKCDESRNLESGASVKVLSDPSETFTVALSLKDRAHEKFEGPSMKLWPRNFAFPSCLTIQAKSLTEFFFRTGTRPVDLVAENKDGAVCELLVREKRVELGFWLDKSVSITNVDQKNDGIDGGKIISPNLKLKIEELVEFLTTDETWIMDIYVTVSMDRTSSAPNILSAVYFWIRFFDFDLKYWILSSILTFYYSITCYCFMFVLWKMIRSLVNLSGLLNAVTKVATGCLKTTKDTIFAVCYNVVSLKVWKIWNSVYIGNTKHQFFFFF